MTTPKIVELEPAGWTHRVDSEGVRACQTVYATTYDDGTVKYETHDDPAGEGRCPSQGMGCGHMSVEALATMQLCNEGLMIRQGPMETHFTCFLLAEHDGYHRDPEWGIWEMPPDLLEE